MRPTPPDARMPRAHAERRWTMPTGYRVKGCERFAKNWGFSRDSREFVTRRFGH
jgi:hypothetical protein